MSTTSGIARAGRGPAPHLLLDRWNRLGRNRLGRWIFSRMVGRAAPYSGSVRAAVLELTPGRSRVEMHDRARLRNHLRSIHACALVTLGELASGLAMIAALPADARAILVGLEIEYVKKARGTLQASGSAPQPQGSHSHECVARAEIRDGDGDVVSRIATRWLIGPTTGRLAAGSR